MEFPQHAFNYDPVDGCECSHCHNLRAEKLCPELTMREIREELRQLNAYADDTIKKVISRIRGMGVRVVAFNPHFVERETLSTITPELIYSGLTIKVEI